MRPFLLSILLILGTCLNCKALIGIGYSYKNVLFWRFWEMKEGRLVPELLVYNTGNTAISFAMRKTYVEGGCTPSKTTREQYAAMDAQYGADTVVPKTTIPPHQYTIFTIPKALYGQGYNAAFVNGHGAGIAGGMQEPDKNLVIRHPYKYYSCEGEYASANYGTICTDQIFTKRGEKGHLLLYFDFNDQQKWQFFTGISDMSAAILGGLSTATITFAGQPHTLNINQKTEKFAANIDKSQPYIMDISFTVAENSEFPDLDLRYYFQNGNAGSRMPIFVP